jgi:3-hydroxybutyryl-CoA dehydratase
MPGIHFEEFSVGQKFVSTTRTMTESDILSFAELTGDHNRIHTDEEYTRGTTYGKRIAHGLLGLSMAVGLLMQTGMLENTVMAFREIIEWKFTRPVFIGDSIHAEMEVRRLKDMPRTGGGLVVVAMDVKNQKAEILMRGTLSVLVASKK